MVFNTFRLWSVALGIAVSVTSAAAQQSWTVQSLGEAVEETIRRFETISLQADYTEIRDVNRFRDEEPKLLTGHGHFLYRGDQDRWFLRDDGYSFRSGEAEAYPRTRISGYDGHVHFNGDNRALTLAESGSRRSAQPRGLIWETMLTYPYLQHAFERESTRITFAGADAGQQVVEIESTWGDQQSPWRMTVRLDTQRSMLPLWQKLYFRDQLYADSKIDRIEPLPSAGAWYPKLITTKFHQPALGIIERRSTITEIDLPDSLPEDAFRFDAVPGADIVDRRSNLAWHDDPWWDELMPWLSQQLNWPRYQFNSLHEFASHCDPAIVGVDAPPISASAWWGEDPGPWDRPDRSFSVLFFWGAASSLSAPFPKWTTELGQLDRVIEPFGGEVIGIASHRTDPKQLQSVAQELMIRIPLAIDQVDDGEGQTHSAYKLQHYYSVLVVDGDGKVHTVGPDNPLLDVIGKILPADQMEALQMLVDADVSMTRAEHDMIKAHWIKQWHSTHGSGKIHGRVRPSQGATVKLAASMKMLMSNNPGGYMLFIDHRGGRSVEVDQATGAFEFENLPRGVYQLSLHVDGKEVEKVELLLPSDDSLAEHQFTQ